MPDGIRLTPIGYIRTPYKTLEDCPKGPDENNGKAKIELLPNYADGLMKLEAAEVDLLYWFDRAPRSQLRGVSPHDGIERGVFAMRSPHRPNPIALSRVKLLSISGNILTVSGMDCLDGTVLLDIKPASRKR